jgi:hypothetical protein
MGDSQNREAEELDESFQLLSGNLKSAIENQQLRSRDQLWKATDPEGYKKNTRSCCGKTFQTSLRVTVRLDSIDEGIQSDGGRIFRAATKNPATNVLLITEQEKAHHERQQTHQEEE